MPNASKTFFTKAILLRYLGNWKRRLCAYLRWKKRPTGVMRKRCVRCALREPAKHQTTASGPANDLGSKNGHRAQASDAAHGH